MKVYYIPDGIPNVKEYFPTINFKDIEEWSIYVKDDQGNTIASTRTNKNGCCCIEDKSRIHFVNSLGEIDSINFIRVFEETETKSDNWEKSLQFPLDKTKGGVYRKNVKSNESYEVETKCYGEQEQYFIKELMATTKAWVEVFLPNGFLPSTKKEFIPIEILDVKVPTKKNTNRYEYVVRIKYSMSNDNITLR